MRKILFAIAMILLVSCTGNKTNDVIVPDFAQGYFLRNDVSVDAVPGKITSQEQLLQFFGMATVMGENGKPTTIDFDKNFVVPVIYPVTDQETSVVVNSIKKTGANELTLDVSAIRGEEHHSYTIRPMELLIIDNQYRDFDIDLQLGE
jgi:hypothetical protein